MGWYRSARAAHRAVYALRKHNLNVDLHIHCMADTDSGQDGPPRLQAIYMKSICGAAVMKGLDVIGIVSKNSFDPGRVCQQIAAQNQYDLAVLSGVEVKSSEGVSTVVFNATTVPIEGEPLQAMCKRAHAEGGIVMVIQPSKHNMQKVNEVAGTPDAPDMIEIYNDMAKSGYVHAFSDINAAPEFQLVVNSAAKSPQELDASVMMTRIPRDYFVEKGIIQEEQGVDYVPPYLRNVRPPGRPMGPPEQPMRPPEAVMGPPAAAMGGR